MLTNTGWDLDLETFVSSNRILLASLEELLDRVTNTLSMALRLDFS